jgi:hypothetical protein
MLGESEDKGKRKDTGDPKGSEDLQDIREKFNEAEKPTEQLLDGGHLLIVRQMYELSLMS